MCLRRGIWSLWNHRCLELKVSCFFFLCQQQQLHANFHQRANIYISMHPLKKQKQHICHCDRYWCKWLPPSIFTGLLYLYFCFSLAWCCCLKLHVLKKTCCIWYFNLSNHIKPVRREAAPLIHPPTKSPQHGHQSWINRPERFGIVLTSAASISQLC